MEKYKEKIEEFNKKFEDFAEDHVGIATFCVFTVIAFLFMVGVTVTLVVGRMLWLIMGVFSLFIIIPVIIGIITGLMAWEDSH